MKDATERITSLQLLKREEFKVPADRRYTLCCAGCGAHVSIVQSGRAGGTEVLCFTCRQLAYAAAHPRRFGIVEGSA